MLAIEANDEWLVGRSYISQKSMAPLRDAASEQDLSLQIKTSRSSSSPPDPRTTSPTR